MCVCVCVHINMLPVQQEGGEGASETCAPPPPPPLFPATALPPSLLTFAETERSDDVIDKGP